MVLSIFPKRPRSEFPRASKLARRVLQLLATKTLVITVSQGCSCLKATSLLQNFNGFADSVVLGLVSSCHRKGLIFVHHQPVASP